jgi:hypothetical protein
MRFKSARSAYGEESVDGSQMDIKRETRDIRTWKEKHLFLDISSTNTDTLVPSLPQCVETPSTEAFLTVVSAALAPGRVSFATFERP